MVFTEQCYTFLHKSKFYNVQWGFLSDNCMCVCSLRFSLHSKRDAKVEALKNTIDTRSKQIVLWKGYISTQDKSKHHNRLIAMSVFIWKRKYWGLWVCWARAAWCTSFGNFPLAPGGSLSPRIRFLGSWGNGLRMGKLYSKWKPTHQTHRTEPSNIVVLNTSSSTSGSWNMAWYFLVVWLMILALHFPYSSFFTILSYHAPFVWVMGCKSG